MRANSLPCAQCGKSILDLTHAVWLFDAGPNRTGAYVCNRMCALIAHGYALDNDGNCVIMEVPPRTRKGE